MRNYPETPKKTRFSEGENAQWVTAAFVTRNSKATVGLKLLARPARGERGGLATERTGTRFRIRAAERRHDAARGAEDRIAKCREDSCVIRRDGIQPRLPVRRVPRARLSFPDTAPMAATRLRRVGGRDDDLLHHVPLHLVRHGVRRHAIVAGGARNPDPSAGDVDDAVTNAATVASLLAAEKADKEKKLESFRRGTRRRVAARVAAERGDDARHTADIALAVARDTSACARARRAGGTNEALDEAHEPTPLARLLRSARDALRESHRSALATFVPAAFGGDRDPLGSASVEIETLPDETTRPENAVPPDVAESRRQRVKNARDAAAAAQRAAASRRTPTREHRAARWDVDGVATKALAGAPAETIDANGERGEREEKKPTTEDVTAWLAHRGLTLDAVPRVCACPHSRASAPFDAAASFRCAVNCPLYGDPDLRDEATRAALRAL